MFTLKLIQNGGPDRGRTVILETTGVWADYCSHGVRQIQAFKKTVGVEDENGTFTCYVGGDRDAFNKNADMPRPTNSPDPVKLDDYIGGNYFDWGVLENAQGKTTEMFR